MATQNLTEILPYFHPDDPAGYLKPGDTLMAGGYDFAWCFAWYKEVPGFPTYQVGSNGALWNCSRNKYRTRTNRWLRTVGSIQDGYLRVTLWNGANSRKVFIHDLVLEVFVSLRPDGLECRHFNGKRVDNRLSNLWWGTPLQNAADQLSHGTRCRGSKSGNAKLTEEDVEEMYRRASLGETYQSIAMSLGVDSSRVSHILRGDEWKHVNQDEPIMRSRLIGSGNRRAKLTEADVPEIRRLAAGGTTHRAIGKLYGVYSSSITRILAGESWKHVDSVNGGPVVVRPPPRDRAGNATLYPDQVREILALRRQGVRIRIIAEKFGISKSTIGLILRGETWKEIPRE